jgi:hypothetical protein
MGDDPHHACTGHARRESIYRDALLPSASRSHWRYDAQSICEPGGCCDRATGKQDLPRQIPSCALRSGYAATDTQKGASGRQKRTPP